MIFIKETIICCKIINYRLLIQIFILEVELWLKNIFKTNEKKKKNLNPKIHLKY